MGKITQQLHEERRKIDKMIRCARSALKQRPEDKTAKACLKFSEAKRKLVQHLEIRHKGLLVAMLALICMAFSVPPMPLKPVLRSPKDQGNQPKVLIKPALFVVPPPKLLTVAWDYTNAPPTWTNYITFEVWRSGITYVTNKATGFDTNDVPFQYDAVASYITNWTLFNTTTNLYSNALATNNAGFFRVRAHNWVNNTFSDWSK